MWIGSQALTRSSLEGVCGRFRTISSLLCIQIQSRVRNDRWATRYMAGLSLVTLHLPEAWVVISIQRVDGRGYRERWMYQIVENNKQLRTLRDQEASLRYDSLGAPFARGVTIHIVSTKLNLLIVSHMLHLEKETQLPCQFWAGGDDEITYILDRQFSKCRVWISRKRSFRHGKLLVLKLDNLLVSRWASIGVKRGIGQREGQERRRRVTKDKEVKTHLILDRILHNQLDNLDRPLLSKPMNSIHSLIFNRRIPPWIHHKHHRRFCQILSSAPITSMPSKKKAYKGHTSCFEGDEENSDSGVIHEMLDCSVSLLWCHTSFKPANLIVSLDKLEAHRQLTLKPARWSRKAIKSRKETNWELPISLT